MFEFELFRSSEGRTIRRSRSSSREPFLLARFVCKLSRRRNELCESSGLGNGGGDVVAAVAVVVAEDVVVVVAAADVVAMVTGEALSMICPESERKF